MTTWNDITTAPENVIVMTRVSDDRGIRNVQRLFRQGNLWWMPNGSMYVYYRPTHWHRV